jgi:hypothetical protein
MDGAVVIGMVAAGILQLFLLLWFYNAFNKTVALLEKSNTTLEQIKEAVKMAAIDAKAARAQPAKGSKSSIGLSD